ncbi:hypothetical protein V6N12_046070 [Hibiscus sabdariffa]|uniref:Uncharacterized protein n=1 Tax=Hibiscus sabdariffa TaxID=183260 RepID=A0ABR2G4J9_9ROSI
MYKVSNPEMRPKAGRGTRASTSVVAMVPGQIAQVVEEGSGFDHNHAALSIVEPGQLEDSRIVLRPVTQEWVQNISNQLNSIVARAVGDFEGVTKASVSETRLLEPVDIRDPQLDLPVDVRDDVWKQLTVVYGSPHRSMRKYLWDRLVDLTPPTNVLWEELKFATVEFYKSLFSGNGGSGYNYEVRVAFPTVDPSSIQGIGGSTDCLSEQSSKDREGCKRWLIRLGWRQVLIGGKLTHMAFIFWEVVHQLVRELSRIAMEGGFAGSLRLLGSVLSSKLSCGMFMLGWRWLGHWDALQRPWKVMVQYFPRTDNIVADQLAKLAHHASIEIIVLEQLPLECQEAVRRDGVT